MARPPFRAAPGSKARVQRLPTVVRNRQWDSLLDATQCARDRALVAVMLYAALRVSEACGLDVPDVDQEGMMVHVRPEIAKRSKEAYVYLSRRALLPLQAYLAERGCPSEGPVFVTDRGRLSRTQAWRIVRAAGAAAGLGEIWPHVLRHSCATHLLEQGAAITDVRDHLRHDSVVTTERYLHLANSRLKRIADEM